VTHLQIFVSYDGEHDADLHELLRIQSKQPGSSFDLAACSQGESMNETWASSARTRIRAADEVIFICGEHTHESLRVSAELRIAQEESKPYLLLWGRREQMCTKPDGARPGDAMYTWDREILEHQMAAVIRAAKPRPVPEACLRP
jgi:hypothetical protein